MSSLLLKNGKATPAAETCLRRAVALDPKDATARVRLGSLMSHQGHLEEAIELFLEAQRISPNNPDAHSGYGQVLISQGKLDEAAPSLQRALALDKDQLDAHLGTARMLLLKGDLVNGWREYEWRRKKSEAKIPKLPGTEWDGSPLAGKTLLIYTEQGFGDLLHFIRYVPIIARSGARIILAVPEPLAKLLSQVPGVAQMVTSLRPLPSYDFHVPLLTIPRLIGITLDRIPNQVPYLKAPPGGPVLPAPLGTRVKIGVAWAGSTKHTNDRNRSISVEDFMPLAAVHGVTLYSLQTGPRSGDIGRLAHPALIRDLSHHLKDFTDTAGVISQLDVVITVDTAVAHLAGAMGKAVWVLTPYAPDWRWLLKREDTPWYPTMRLLRQSEPNRWDDVVARAAGDIARIAANRPDYGSEGEITLHSVFPRPDGQPRFRMWAPRRYMGDAGIRYLVQHERWRGGYEYATRSFLDAHTEAGDLFLDIGAHWGIMSLQAATRWPGQVKVIACEPSENNQSFLRRWIDDNGLTQDIELVGAAVADKPGKGGLLPESTMGYMLEKRDDGAIPVVTVDGLIAERPELAGRRVGIKIDVEGLEPEVITGMKDLLESGRVAFVAWERGYGYDSDAGRARVAGLRARFNELGFTAWRFASEYDAGAMEPFVDDGWHGNVFELAPGLEPLPSYGVPRPPVVAQPEDGMLDSYRRAGELMAQGGALQGKNRIDQALAMYTQVSALDTRLHDLWNNLGVALRGMGRLRAAEACYRRGLALQPRNPGTLSNLGNLLRERGKLEEAAKVHSLATALRPDSARFLYNAALVSRDDGRPKEARAMFEKILEMEPDNSECRWDWALSLLQDGDYERGLPAYDARFALARSMPRSFDIPRWTGKPLKGKTIFLHDEQGFGDVLMFARFIPEVKRRGAGKVILECQPELMRLMSLAPGVDQVVARGTPTPPCDFFAPLLSLAGIFKTKLKQLPHTVPYLKAPEPAFRLRRPDSTDPRLKIGIVWAGKPTPRDRSIPLDQLLPVLHDPRFSLYSLQMGPRAADLKAIGADALVVDVAPKLTDFAETAALLSQLDLLVTCDTSIAHLAGALGIPTFVTLLYTSDWRWFDQGEDSPWYPSLRLFRQDTPFVWDGLLGRLGEALRSFAEERRP